MTLGVFSPFRAVSEEFALMRGGKVLLASIAVLVVHLCVLAQAAAQGQSGSGSQESLESILRRIEILESDRDPKCVATATRLENLIYGTPLSAEARYEKIALQKELIESVWGPASARAAEQGRTDVSIVDLLSNQVLTSQRSPEGDVVVTIADGNRVAITARDFDHYSSIAYALRAVLSVEQEQLLESSDRLLPLDAEAMAELERILNVYTLATLQLADRDARLANDRELTAERLNHAWGQVGSAPTTIVEAEPSTSTATSDFTVIRSVIEQKISSYEAYNEISTPVFLRNLQVYFARYRWPSNPQSAEAFSSAFTESLVAYVEDVLTMAQDSARQAGHALIRAEDVEPVIGRFVPYQVNEYEDVIFFPRLGGDRVVLEAYDVDSFRDGGLHWRYLQFALDNPDLGLRLEPDPFAAELVVEGAAQFGVLVLRMAGLAARGADAESLELAHLESGFAEIQRRVDAHTTAAPEAARSTEISSASSPSSGASDNILFADVTMAVGIDFDHRSADWLSRLLRSYLVTGADTATLSIPPAFGGAGVAAEDIDNDGDVDILLVGGMRNALYINQGNGEFIDGADAAGINFLRPDGSSGEPRQPVIVDFDNDGVQDIFVTYVGDKHRLYRGIGDGRFVDVSTDSGLGGEGLVGGPAVVFDYDRDGLVDIYIGYFGNYLEGALPTLSRRNVNGSPNKLFRNIGGLRFADVTTGSGVDNTGWAQAASHTDIDGDGWQDLIVGNDFGVNSYYRNRGNGTFEDIAAELGTDKPSFTMNVGIADLNRDTFPDIYISNIVTMVKDDKYTMPDAETPMQFTPETMARMRVVEANDLFTSVTNGSALEGYVLSDAVERGYNSTGWAWDADFFDFDNDSDDDLYVLNGMNEYAVYSDTPYYTSVYDEQMEITLPVSQTEANVFFVNEGGTLQNRAEESGVDMLGNSRSAAYLDIEGDGDLDMVLNNYHGPAVLYRNELQGSDRNWLKVRLVGDPRQGTTRDAIGARMILTTDDGQQVWREVHGTIGYLSVHPREQHFGLGAAERARLTIIWPNGERQEIGALDANQRWIVTQGAGVTTR